MANAKTILYVDDDAVSLTAYKNVLEREGYVVATAPDGVEALKCLHQAKPDLMVLDLALPRLSGAEVLKFMYAEPKLRDLPVVVLSGNFAVKGTHQELVDKVQAKLLKHACSIDEFVQTVNIVLMQAALLSSVPAGQTEAAKKIPAEAPEAMVGQELQNQPQVVCAWTNRIKVNDEWITITEFLSKHLHVPVSHGISPDAMEQMLKGNDPKPPPAG